MTIHKSSYTLYYKEEVSYLYKPSSNDITCYNICQNRGYLFLFAVMLLYVPCLNRPIVSPTGMFVMVVFCINNVCMIYDNERILFS